MAMINKVLGSFINKLVQNYLDEVLVYLYDGFSHAKHVRVVLQALQTHHLHVNLIKYESDRRKIEVLGT